MLIQVPLGNSHNQITRLKNTIHDVILFGSNNDTDEEIHSHHIVQACEKSFPDAFLKLAKEKNYCSEALISGKLDDTLCNSMTEEANLSAKQGCIVCRYLSYDFGTNVVVPEKVRRTSGPIDSNMQFKSFDQVIDEKSVKYT